MDALTAKLEKLVKFYMNDVNLTRRYKPIHAGLIRVNKLRNTYIHSRWYFLPGQPATRIKDRRNYGVDSITEYEHVDIDKLRVYSSDLSFISKELTSFIIGSLQEVNRISFERRKNIDMSEIFERILKDADDSKSTGTPNK